jgi:predicted transcriptional regulator
MNYRAMRWNRMLNQAEFWARVGVTQSAGSRYESGRVPPKPVRILLDIAYSSATRRAATLRKLRAGLGA